MQLAIVFITVFGVFLFADARSVLFNTDEEGPKSRWMFVEDDFRKLHVIDLEAKVPRVYVEDTDVVFYYQSRNTEQTEFSVNNVDILKNTDFNPNRRTMFVIHGWLNDKSSPVNSLISKALLKVEDWNVINVDWSYYSKSLYHTAVGAVPEIGEIVAKCIQHMISLLGLRPSKLQITGHSLGAHVSGRAGLALKRKNVIVPVIVGMDPAKPFISEEPDDRLDKQDATHVHVIHTNAGFLGMSITIGHADFFPNKGSSQNGCGIDIIGKCAHGRSYIYFAESIESNKFKARRCNDEVEWDNGLCNDNPFVAMGGNIVNTKASGIFYLDTAASEPFALD